MLTSAYPLDLAAILEFFERTGLRCTVDAERTQIAVPNPDRAGWALRVVPRHADKMISLIYPLPGAIPHDRVPALTIAANELNARTYMGAWVLNPVARELSFRLTVRTEGVLYTDKGLLALFQLVVGAVDNRVDYLNGVLEGGPPV